MIIPFTAVDQSTIWDVVNNTYGSADFIVKLMDDNNFPNINTYPKKGQIFLFDDTLVVNQNNLQSNLSTSKFATRERTSTNDGNMVKYEQVNQAEYTSNADGTTIVVLTGLIGCRIIQIEKEIQPMKAADFSFNPSSAQLNLLNGQTVDNGMTLYILYAKMITS